MKGTDIDLYVGGECVERLYMEPGDSFEAEVHTDEFKITIPENDIEPETHEQYRLRK